MASEVWNSGDDSAPPVFDYLLGLIDKDSSSLVEIALVFFCESDADF